MIAKSQFIALRLLLTLGLLFVPTCYGQALGSPTNPIVVGVPSGADYLVRLSAVNSATPNSMTGNFWVRYSDGRFQRWGVAGGVGSSSLLTETSGIKNSPYFVYQWGYWFGSAGYGSDGGYYDLPDYFGLGYDPAQCLTCVTPTSGGG